MFGLVNSHKGKIMRQIVYTVIIFLAITGIAGNIDAVTNDVEFFEIRTLSQKIDEFSGWLLITDDQDWREKWDTPEHSIPKFNETHEVRLGEKITILTFFRNPLADENGQIDIRCDLTITKPDGSLSFQQENMECANEKLQGAPGNLRLTSVIIDFIGELGDPYGRWTIEVTLKDANRGVEVPLQTYFELKNTARFTRWQLKKREEGYHG